VSERGFVLDCWVRRTDGGRVLVGGAPARLVRLTVAGASTLDRALAGDLPHDGESAKLVDRLVGHGLLHPTGAPAPRVPSAVQAVVPVRNGIRWIGDVVRALGDVSEVVVVDDGSTDCSGEAAAAAGARVVGNDRTPGPAGARNAGLAVVSSELVALVDADCVAGPGWLEPLLGLFEDDDRLALAAPRVLSAPGGSALAAYERACSPLDLGSAPGIVGRGRRLSYVPSAALLARRTALAEVGGFAEELAVGEDVDLAWRLIEAGWTVRYAPESRCVHHPRTTIRGFARQRSNYGASAVVLDARHPGAVAPLRVAPATVAVWLTAAVRGPAAACAVAAASLGAVAAGPHASGSRGELALLALRGHLHATRHLARIAVREWLPLTAVAATRSRRVRRLGALALAVDVAGSWEASRSPRPAVHAALRTVDNLAYTRGLWATALRARTFGAAAIRLAGRRGRSNGR
jgi:mycofactocin glycosyltransferase